MRFALLGDHPDGVEMAGALAQSGRHRVIAYTAPVSEDVLRRWGGEARRVGDVEEVLADPAVEAVLVAGAGTVRPAQLRRALQSERHVLCVHPADQTPEIAYEAAMIRNDTGCVLLPLLPEATHPAFRRLADFLHRKDEAAAPIGSFRLLEMERGATGEVLDGVLDCRPETGVPRLGHSSHRGRRDPGGVRLRPARGVARGRAGAAGRAIRARRAVSRHLVAGRKGAAWRLTAIGSAGRVELLFPLGWNGPAFLDWRDANGQVHEEYWERWDPWPVLIDTFERMIEARSAERQGLSWQDAIRALELDDAARRSVERRRSSVLEYPEATEEVGFKGTMTLVGCSLVWAVLLLLILSVWWPKVGWLIVPLIVVFLGLQFLRYLVPGRREK